MVHPQERLQAVCCRSGMWYFAYYSIRPDVMRKSPHTKFATHSFLTLLRMDHWGPKHVEPPRVMNKLNHKTLCILLDYIYIARWYTVHTISSFPTMFRKIFKYQFFWKSYQWEPTYSMRTDGQTANSRVTQFCESAWKSIRCSGSWSDAQTDTDCLVVSYIYYSYGRNVDQLDCEWEQESHARSLP